jgi:hypothetical protein
VCFGISNGSSGSDAATVVKSTHPPVVYSDLNACTGLIDAARWAGIKAAIAAAIAKVAMAATMMIGLAPEIS